MPQQETGRLVLGLQTDSAIKLTLPTGESIRLLLAYSIPGHNSRKTRVVIEAPQSVQVTREKIPAKESRQ